MKKLIALLVLAVLIGGCVTTSSNLYNSSMSYVPTNPQTVSVFQEIPTHRSFIKTGEVTVDKAPNWSTAEKKLKEETAKIGGDAVYIAKMDSRVGSSGFTMTMGNAPRGDSQSSVLLGAFKTVSV